MLTQISFISFSYSVAAAAFSLLLLQLLLRQRQHKYFLLFAVAAGGSALWAAVTAYASSQQLLVTPLQNATELARDAAWLLLLLGLCGYPQQLGWSRHKAGWALLGIAFLLLLIAPLLFDNAEFITLIVARTLIAIAGLLLLEQLYRNIPPEKRWNIKYLCLGLGGILAFDFYLYTHAMLFQQINPDIWSARGLVNAMIVPLIGLTIVRTLKWPADFSVSHRMLFHTATLVSSAIYLLTMALVGVWIKYYGGNWGAILQLIFLFGALSLLLVLLFSGSLRAWFRVLISKHFLVIAMIIGKNGNA